jgi:hypothetical protein
LYKPLILRTEQGLIIKTLEDLHCTLKVLETILTHNTPSDSVALSVGVEVNLEQEDGVAVVDIEEGMDQVDTGVLTRGENQESVVLKKNIEKASRLRNHPMVEAVEVAETIAIMVEEDIHIQMVNTRRVNAKGLPMDDEAGEGLADGGEEDLMIMSVEDVVQEVRHQIHLVPVVSI